MVLLALLVLAALAVQLINPQVMRRFLDGVQDGQPLAALQRGALLFMALAVLRQALRLGSTYVGEVVAWTATNALRADLALHCLQLDMDFHKVHKPGELIERVDGDINQLSQFFSRLVVDLTGNLLLATGVMILLWRINWVLGAAVMTIVGDWRTGDSRAQHPRGAAGAGAARD